MNQKRKNLKIGWQLIDGVWHQVVKRTAYDRETYELYVVEHLLPEPKVTLASAGEMMRHGGGIFTYMRYW